MPQGATISIGLGPKGTPRRAAGSRFEDHSGDAANGGSLTSASRLRATASCRSAVLRCHNQILGRRLPSRATTRSASAAWARNSAADCDLSLLRPPRRQFHDLVQ